MTAFKRLPKEAQELIAGPSGARNHFGVFCLLVHDTDMPHIDGGKAALAKHHDVMAEALVDDKLGHTLILAPRGSAKTTLVQWWLEWKLGRAKTELGENWANMFWAIYISATAAQAYKVSNAMKATITNNDWYKLIFPHIKPDKNKWAEPEWKVKGNTVKDSTFLALGRRGPVLGARGTIVVLDDIVDADVRKSKVEQEDTEFWLDNTVDKVMVPGGRFVMVATRWYDEDPPKWAMELGWHTVLLKAINEVNGEETSFWPERFTLEALQDSRKSKPMSFALQMQNEITPYEGILFQREWFTNCFHRALSKSEVRYTFATWDTAGTRTGRSYTVGLVIDVTRDWAYHIKHMFRDKVEYHDLKRAIREVARAWRVDASIIEEKATGQPALQEMRLEYEKHAEPWMRTIPVLPPGQRGGPGHFEWVEQITIPCEERRVWLPSSDFLRRHNVEDWTDTFLNEMLAYPDGSNDDIVVALTQLLFHVEREKPAWDAEDAYALEPPMRYETLPSGEKKVAV
ncbi:hypothetical protein LCGC14_0445230 [marine sediment metagenome]|uniref:Terminase large subunit gp17-like C-terminal domain-containing protein n=1 Tax=marine sediment metagenome TaxID=412755 RepID=A0A0F9V693_9ZZZZ